MPIGSQQKHLLRQAGPGLAPDEVFTRMKTGISLPIGEWMLGDLREQHEAVVCMVANCRLVDARGHDGIATLVL